MPENLEDWKLNNKQYVAYYDLATAMYKPRDMSTSDLIHRFRILRSDPHDEGQTHRRIARIDVICNELRNRGIEPGDID